MRILAFASLSFIIGVLALSVDLTERQSFCIGLIFFLLLATLFGL